MSSIGDSLLCVTAVTVVCSCEIYCTECWSWVLHVIGRRFKVHSLEDTSHQVDSGIAAWMKYIAVNINWKILHSRCTVVLQFEFNYQISGRRSTRQYTADVNKWKCALRWERILQSGW